MTESRRGQRPTPEQRRARQEAAEARAAKQARKVRTRRLIQMGGVLAAYGFSDPEQVDELVRAVLSSKAGPAWVLGLGVRPTSKWPQS